MKKVIYTVLTGGYDRLTQPEAVRADYDYICFTDNPGKGSDGVWQLRPIPFETPDPITRARYAKLQPHVVLPEYDWSVFMDANLCITGDAFYEAAEAMMSAYFDAVPDSAAVRKKVEDIKNRGRYT